MYMYTYTMFARHSVAADFSHLGLGRADRLVARTFHDRRLRVGRADRRRLCVGSTQVQTQEPSWEKQGR